MIILFKSFNFLQEYPLHSGNRFEKNVSILQKHNVLRTVNPLECRLREVLPMHRLLLRGADIFHFPEHSDHWNYRIDEWRQIIRFVIILHPFHNVAIQVVQSPVVCLFAAHSFCSPKTFIYCVCFQPGVGFQQ